MGYSAVALRQLVAHWLDAGWLKAGDRLIEFGSQEFHASPEAARDSVRAFLAGRGVPQGTIADVLRDPMPSVRRVYEAIGVQYDSIDIDGERDATFFDLNTWATPDQWLGVFDFVNNEGTIEHLTNPINGFHVAHEMLKLGGVARHSFPLIGWRDHGFLYGTTKFYSHLVGDNGYELLEARAYLMSEPAPFDDPFFKTVMDPDLNEIEKPHIVDMWGTLIYRKIKDRPFVLPADHRPFDGASRVREALNRNFMRFSAHRLPPGPGSMG
jgi:hypothetical protein